MRAFLVCALTLAAFLVSARADTNCALPTNTATSSASCKADGSSCTISCNTGTRTSAGLTKVTATCTGGSWSYSSDPTCTLIDCGAPSPTAPNYQAYACATTTYGAVCQVGCTSGYTPTAAVDMLCSTSGFWTVLSGQLPTCTDLNACSGAACADGISTCIDEPPPSTGYHCQCAPGYGGDPKLVAADGTGCKRAAIRTNSSEGMRFDVGAGLDYIFTTVGGDVTVAHLQSALNTATSQEVVLSTTISSMADNINQLPISTLSSAVTSAATVTQAVSTAMSQNTLSVAAANSLASAVSSAVVSLQAGPISAEQSRAQSAEDSLTSRVNQLVVSQTSTTTFIQAVSSTAIKAQSSVGTEISRATSAETSLATSIGGVSTLVATLSSSDDTVKTQGNAVSTLTNTVSTFANTVSTATAAEVTRAVSAETSIKTDLSSTSTKTNSVSTLAATISTQSSTLSTSLSATSSSVSAVSSLATVLSSAAASSVTGAVSTLASQLSTSMATVSTSLSSTASTGVLVSTQASTLSTSLGSVSTLTGSVSTQASTASTGVAAVSVALSTTASTGVLVSTLATTLSSALSTTTLTGTSVSTLASQHTVSIQAVSTSLSTTASTGVLVSTLASTLSTTLSGAVVSLGSVSTSTSAVSSTVVLVSSGVVSAATSLASVSTLAGSLSTSLSNAVVSLGSVSTSTSAVSSTAVVVSTGLSTTTSTGLLVSTLASTLSISVSTVSAALSTTNIAVNAVSTLAATLSGVSASRGSLPNVVTDSFTCNSTNKGQLAYDPITDSVVYCSATGVLRSVGYIPPGLSSNAPALTCTDVYNGGNNKTGVYWIKALAWTYAAQHYCIFPVTSGDPIIDVGGDGSLPERAGQSCRTIQDLWSVSASGAYYISTVDGPLQTMCDFSNFGGGWTLMVTSTTSTWTTSSILKRGTASLSSDFSFLQYGNAIKESPVTGNTTFQFRLEATSAGRYGGIFNAPRWYPLASSYNFLTNINIETKWDWSGQWADDGLEQHLPYILGGYSALTTSGGRVDQNWWGTIAATGSSFSPAPWINTGTLNPNPGKIWYWIREGAVDTKNRYTQIHRYGMSTANPGTSCVDIKTKNPTDATALGIYYIKDGSGNPVRRLCHMARSPAQDLGGEGNTAANAAMSCRVLFDYFWINSYSYSDVYYLNPAGTVFQTYCDMTNYGGGYTMLVVSKTTSWTVAQTLGPRGTAVATLDQDFSVLCYADSIKGHNATTGDFTYRIHGGSITGMGGIWTAPRSYSFVARTNGQTSLLAFTQIGSYTYPSDNGIEARMPWVGTTGPGLLTTSTYQDSAWWGTLTSAPNSGYNPSPYIYTQLTDPGVIMYALREGSLSST